jgi:TetR/AcrR family tetracycline transcriptional repressor
MARPRAIHDSLSRDSIVSAALRVLEQEGLDGLTMRRIADDLDVQAPALYWYVENRSDLLGLMAEELLRQALDKLDPNAVGGEFLLLLGRALGRQQHERRDVARLIAVSSPSPEGHRRVQTRIHSRLIAGGVADPVGATMAVFAFTLGWALFHAHPPMNAHIANAMSPEKAFDAGLRAIVAGFSEV